MEVTKDVSDPNNLHAKKYTVGTTPIKIDPTLPNRGIQIKADSGNGGTVYIGGSDVSSTLGFPLEASEGLFIPLADTKNIWFLGSTSGQNFYIFVI